jgi:DNA adenine methylase
LRYPGGKAALGPYISYLLDLCSSPPRDYAEPYCGGAGAGLYLLYHEHVERVLLNDLDECIWSFWFSALHRTDAFVDLVTTTPVTLESWHEQRAILADTSSDVLARGFATFFLNRTNRSGIIRARPIGGLNQTGRWKIDARYNAPRLIERLRRLAQYKNRIVLSRENGADFVRRLASDSDTFIYADPPYLVKSGGLYMNAMEWHDHEDLAVVLRDAECPWFLTYDADERVQALYPENPIAGYRLKHTAGRQRIGAETGVFSRRLELGSLMALPSGDGEWLRQRRPA